MRLRPKAPITIRPARARWPRRRASRRAGRASRSLAHRHRDGAEQPPHLVEARDGAALVLRVDEARGSTARGGRRARRRASPRCASRASRRRRARAARRARRRPGTTSAGFAVLRSTPSAVEPISTRAVRGVLAVAAEHDRSAAWPRSTMRSSAMPRTASGAALDALRARELARGGGRRASARDLAGRSRPRRAVGGGMPRQSARRPSVDALLDHGQAVAARAQPGREGRAAALGHVGRVGSVRGDQDRFDHSPLPRSRPTRAGVRAASPTPSASMRREPAALARACRGTRGTRCLRAEAVDHDRLRVAVALEPGLAVDLADAALLAAAEGRLGDARR